MPRRCCRLPVVGRGASLKGAYTVRMDRDPVKVLGQFRQARAVSVRVRRLEARSKDHCAECRYRASREVACAGEIWPMLVSTTGPNGVCIGNWTRWELGTGKRHWHKRAASLTSLHLIHRSEEAPRLAERERDCRFGAMICWDAATQRGASTNGTVIYAICACSAPSRDFAV